MIGKTLGHYQITEKLGEGGMGVVYKARDTHLDRFAALKVLPPEKVSDPDRKRRFIQEAKAASALNHPSIITIYDIDQADGVDFIAMEYVAGKTLDELISRKGMRLSLALKYAVQIADALARAHGAGIIHRDLKPSNVMVDEHGLVKVLDFGLAKLTEAAGPEAETAATRTGEGTVLGTAACMSPEQAEGKHIDTRSDIFSFGSMLYEMLTGQRAFRGDTRASTIASILREDPKPVSQVAEGLPRDAEKIVRRCLRKDPEQRFQTMADLRVALAELKDESESSQFSGAAMTEPKRTRWHNRRRELMAWIATAFSLVALGIVIWKLRSPALAPGLRLTRLTWDAGVSAWPAISPDGKLVAYVSDRDGQNNLDLYVQQIPGGRAVRITTTEEAETEPAFSPDGLSIAFSSSKDGGGIHIMPAIGGEPRLLVRGGHTPRYSPDGNWIAYWSGPITSGNPTAEGMGRVFVISSAGGTPRQVHPEFPMARWPLWSPDGRLLIFQGVAPGPSLSAAERLDYWVTPAEGGKAESSGLLTRLSRARIKGLFFDLTCWSRDGLFFNPPLGEDLTWGEAQKRIYRCPLDRNGKASGEVMQVSSGTAVDVDATAARNGQIAFASGGRRLNIWGLRIEGNTGKVRGSPYRITEGLAPAIHPSLSRDGSRLLFDSQRNGIQEVWLRDLTTGKETVAVTGGAGGGYFLRSSGLLHHWRPDGDYLLDLSTGESRRIVEVGGIGGIGDFDRKEEWALLRHDTPNAAWDALDLKSGNRTPLLRTEHWPIYLAHFSPDDRWIVFLAFTGPGTDRIYVARPHGLQEIPQTEWSPITDGSALVDKPTFSPDGRLIYFTRDEIGSRSIYAIRFDPESGRPIGGPFLVYEFRGPRLSMLSVNLSDLGLDVAQDKIVMVLAESNWNIWMAEPGSHQ